MRILTFTNLYPSSVLPRHGIFVEHRLRQWLARGEVQLRVVAPLPSVPFPKCWPGSYAQYRAVPHFEERHGIRIWRPRFGTLPGLTSWLNPVSMAVGALPTMRALQKEEDFDAIDAHFVYPDGAAAVLLGKWLNKPVVVSARGTDIHTFPRYRIPRTWIRWVIRQSSAMVSVSSALGRTIEELGAPPGHVRVLRNGVDLNLFTPGDVSALRAELGLGGPVLLSVGHLVPDKGHHLVIEALAQLPAFSLVIAGEGSMKSELQALAARLGVSDRIRWSGNMSQPMLARYYAAADATILASRAEGMPNVLLESMACGTPVIATNVGGNAEVVSAPDAGLLIEERCASAIVAAVTRLTAEAPARERVREHATRSGWAQTTEGLNALFADVIERFQSSSSTSVRVAG